MPGSVCNLEEARGKILHLRVPAPLVFQWQVYGT